MSDTWVLERQGDDRYDVMRNGRRLLSDVGLAEVRRHLKSHKRPRDKVFREEQDGYLTPFR